MSKSRRNYARLGHKLLTFHLTNDQHGCFNRLLLTMSRRWSSDRLTAEEGSRISLSRAEVNEISGKHRADVSLKSLRSLADIVGISVGLRGEVVEIEWPNLPEYQGWDMVDARRLQSNGEPNVYPPGPDPGSGPIKGQKTPLTPPASRAKKSNGSVTKPKPKPRSKKRVPCPEFLSKPQCKMVYDWREANHPGLTAEEVKAQWELHRNHAWKNDIRAVDWVRSFYGWLTGPFYKPVTGEKAAARGFEGIDEKRERINREFGEG